MKPAVFLDRDGVIMEDVAHLHRPSQVRLITGAGLAIKRLNDAGYWVIVVTNQSVIARGMLGVDRLALIHQLMCDELARTGGEVDAIYHCPHHPTAGRGEYKRICDCRKPAPGLIRQAEADVPIDLKASWVIGDKISDVGLGAGLGLRNILVLTGYGKEHSAVVLGTYPDTFVVADLGKAVDLILKEDGLG